MPHINRLSKEYSHLIESFSCNAHQCSKRHNVVELVNSTFPVATLSNTLEVKLEPLRALVRVPHSTGESQTLLSYTDTTGPFSLAPKLPLTPYLRLVEHTPMQCDEVNIFY